MGPRQKGVSTSSTAKAQTPKATQTIPSRLQQRLLDAFCRAFPLSDKADLKDVIQDVKSRLYNRDFAGAFGRTEYLDAYALRWSASRALCYAEIFSHLDIAVWSIVSPTPEHAETESSSNVESKAASLSESASKVVCIGGGAGAEVAALAAVMAQASTLSAKIEVAAIDIADWSSGLSTLEKALTTPTPLPAYASNAAKAANEPIIDPDRLRVKFIHQDILEHQENLTNLMDGVSLCTIMFTLNELFTSSISKTTALLLALSDVMGPGTWLLVVDSPGSYSEIKLGNAQASKQYPMKWLLDHTLLEVVGMDEKGNPRWKKTISEDSQWYRISNHLKYPIDLENMRYQVHLYQKLV